ncbi:MAG: 50S ribosomal protein L15 [Armatimonadota bacterium]|nr:50S ribosomal protein L15 [Armatimonadota bacterium]MDR5702371.1 50S ribosomal protein L15 [Armatimonadota bacterium]MDR7435464.1 50S ribosomal protein L15 [Armatimonadota bacterium]
MFTIGTLKAPRGARKRRKRVGRGIGSGHGTYSTRGIKGQKARSGPGPRPGFEGGQTPLIKRLPFQRGVRGAGSNMTGGPPRPEVAEVNVEDLQRFPPGTVVTPALLRKEGLIEGGPVKILGEGRLDIPLEVHAHAFSRSAREKIEAAGGKVVILGTGKR